MPSASRAQEDVQTGFPAPSMGDDPRARAAARAAFTEPRTPEQQLHLLEVARREAVRWNVAGAGVVETSAAVAGQVWVNLGPDQASYENNGVVYNEIDSGRIRSIVPHPLDPDILYVATSGGGVWKTFDATTPISTDTGPRWTPITDGIGALATGALALDPRSPDYLVLGLGDPFDVQSPGVVTSDNGGATWSAPVALTGSYGGSSVTATSVQDLVIDPLGTGVVLAATNAGLFRSASNGLGASWTLVDPFPDHRQLYCWSVAFLGAQTWLAACREGQWGTARLLRSIDGALTFSDVSGTLPNPNSTVDGPGRMTIAAAASDRGTPNNARVYLLAAALYGTQQKDVYVSGNGGQSWNSLAMFETTTTASGARPRNPNNDQQNLDVIHDQGWYNQAILVDPRDRDVVFVGGNYSLIRSRDGGANWDVIANWLPRSPLIGNQYNLPYIHADWHAMAVSTAGLAKGLPAVFYGGTDGGLFASRDEPASKCVSGNWVYCSAFTAPAGYKGNTVPDGSAVTPFPSPTFTSKMNRGIASLLVYSIAANERDSGSPLVMGGFQDNGTRLRAPFAPGAPSSTFNQVIGGDGFGAAMGISASGSTPPACAGQMGSLLIGTVYAAVYRSIDCGSSFASAMQGICASPIGPLGSCTNGGAGPCCVELGSNFYMKMAADVSDPNARTFLTVINGGGKGDVFRTTTGAQSWTNASGTIALASGGTATQFPGQLVYVAASPRRPGTYLTATRSRAYVTLDGGVTWTETAGLGLSGLSGVALDPSDAAVNTLWATSAAASSPGSPIASHVFVSSDRGAHWTAAGGTGPDALPDVPATAVKVDPNDPATIYVGTELGLYVSTNSGAAWKRMGRGLPMVQVTEISVALDSSAIRISTFGRGFWEINAHVNADTGVYGNGDLDRNLEIDGFDLVLEAGKLWATPADLDYDAVGNLVGTTNQIEPGDLDALRAKLGGRP